MKKINYAELANALRTTLKLQPVVVLYSLVSVSSKLASRAMPSGSGSAVDFIKDCLLNTKLLAIYAFMLAILMIYAVIWQKLIKNVNITIMYANKSSYIFWTQLAAIVLFHERLSFFNIAGIVVIFIGVLVVNKHD
ncbi:MAG: hypothetical protein HFH25_03105 [Lachnospiraceae bacterium]|nr:hypothetical protein [Lachnospiraceae bacterium]